MAGWGPVTWLHALAATAYSDMPRTGAGWRTYSNKLFVMVFVGMLTVLLIILSDPERIPFKP